MLFLTIGLLVSASCGDKEEICHILHQQIRFVNESGTSPIVLTYWLNNQTTSVSFSDNDTVIEVTKTPSPINTPGVVDSIIVQYGNVKTIKYSQEDQSIKGRKSPCLYEYYEVEKKSETETNFTFTFTKDMLE